MSTAYGSYSSGWTPSGSSVSKKYRAKLNYSSSTSSTAVTVSASTDVNINSSVNASFSASMSMSGGGTSTSYTGSGKTVFGNANTVTLINTKSVSFPRKTSAYTVTVSGSVWSSTGKWTGAKSTATGTISVPTLESYAVSYNANGGSGAPSSQTKWYGISLTLSSVIPMRVGYEFINWNTKADGSGTAYKAGASYTANAAVTLYAQWKSLMYTKVDGTWVSSGEPKVKVGGAWKAVSKMLVKVNGTWKEM